MKFTRKSLLPFLFIILSFDTFSNSGTPTFYRIPEIFIERGDDEKALGENVSLYYIIEFKEEKLELAKRLNLLSFQDIKYLERNSNLFRFPFAIRYIYHPKGKCLRANYDDGKIAKRANIYIFDKMRFKRLDNKHYVLQWDHWTEYSRVTLDDGLDAYGDWDRYCYMTTPNATLVRASRSSDITLQLGINFNLVSFDPFRHRFNFEQWKNSLNIIERAYYSFTKHHGEYIPKNYRTMSAYYEALVKYEKMVNTGFTYAPKATSSPYTQSDINIYRVYKSLEK